MTGSLSCKKERNPGLYSRDHRVGSCRQGPERGGSSACFLPVHITAVVIRMQLWLFHHVCSTGENKYKIQLNSQSKTGVLFLFAMAPEPLSTWEMVRGFKD